MLSGPEKSNHILHTAVDVFGCDHPERVGKEHVILGAYKIPATLVETGTADGDNFWRIAHNFPQAFTIELDERPYHDAWQRFVRYPSLTALYGDSSIVLERLIPLIEGPAVFWLDAHYCGGARGNEDTPIATELRHIFTHRQDEPNLILIDDARLFGTDTAYPTVDWVRNFVAAQPCADRYTSVYVENDIIHVEPKHGKGSGHRGRRVHRGTPSQAPA